MAVLTAARKLLRLSVQEWRDMFSAQVAVAVASWAVRTRPLGSLVNPEQRAGAQGTPTSGVHGVHGVRSSSGLTDLAAPLDRSVAPTQVPVADLSARADALATALHRAAGHGLIRPKCLVRSLALQALLNRNGISGSTIRVGVQRNDGQLLAHAWVELNGRVIGDDKYYVRRFVPFSGLELNNTAGLR